jgi:hypothetical protein
MMGDACLEEQGERGRGRDIQVGLEVLGSEKEAFAGLPSSRLLCFLNGAFAVLFSDPVEATGKRRVTLQA